MSYDNTSFYGDLIVEEYDDKNNFIGTITSAGFYVYHILGDGFDSMSDECSKFLNNFSILSADESSLDKYWGVSYNMPRPKLYVGTEQERFLTNEEYKVYLYLRNCRLMTREDLEINLNKVFSYDGFNIYFSEESYYLSVTDHLVYSPAISESTNIGKNDTDVTGDYIVSFGSVDDDVNLLEGNLTVLEEVVQVVNIPANNWDSGFLTFLKQFISVKGNLKIREYIL